MLDTVNPPQGSLANWRVTLQCHKKALGFLLGLLKEGVLSLGAYPADGADVHCLRVVAAVEQALGLQQHSESSLQGEKEKLSPRSVLCSH